MVTRKEAKELGLKRYFTGKPCKHGHVSERLLSTGHCIECSLISSKKYREENKEKIKLYRDNYKKDNKEAIREKNLEYYKNNRSKCLSASSRSRKKNPHTHAACQAKRRSDKIKATPSWANIAEIKDIYKMRDLISEFTGVDHHVDHFIPLKGKTICGLHVEYNLQIIPARDNILKSNKFEGEEYE